MVYAGRICPHIPSQVHCCLNYLIGETRAGILLIIRVVLPHLPT